MKNLLPLGRMAIFYVPAVKLDDSQFGKDGRCPRELFEEFFMENYNAYTLEVSETHGFWREHDQSPILHDQNYRYEVSFEGKKKVKPFVRFLSEMCALMKEQAIYLTMGYKSYLVLPKNEIST